MSEDRDRPDDERGGLWPRGAPARREPSADTESGALHRQLDGTAEPGQIDLPDVTEALREPEREPAPEPESESVPEPAAAARPPQRAAAGPDPAGPREASTEAIIRLIDIHKSFGRQRVFAGVSLDLMRGDTTVVVGPSGTGKSVLLKHVVGLVKPDAGQVWFEGRQIDRLGEEGLVKVREQFGMLFQMGALFDSMNVADNVCFPLVEQRRLKPAERARRCREVLNMVGLNGVEEQMPGDLSGGQRKRVALARAIVLEPKVVLYDEPTTGLDPITAGLINELIITLNRKLGMTSVVVTHDMASANKIADRMVMLYDGRVLADGDPETFSRTDDDTVQCFIHGRAAREDLERIRQGFD